MSHSLTDTAYTEGAFNMAGRGLGANPVFTKQRSNQHPDVINLQVLSNEISAD
jgi:hypothetical protein